MSLFTWAATRSIAVGGGCGKQHVLSGDPPKLDCKVCEAVILATPRLARMWCSDAEDVPLTPEQEQEIADEEERQRDIAARALNQRATEAVAEAKAEIRTTKPRGRKPAGK